MLHNSYQSISLTQTLADGNPSLINSLQCAGSPVPIAGERPPIHSSAIKRKAGDGYFSETKSSVDMNNKLWIRTMLVNWISQWRKLNKTPSTSSKAMGRLSPITTKRDEEIAIMIENQSPFKRTSLKDRLRNVLQWKMESRVDLPALQSRHQEFLSKISSLKIMRSQSWGR